MWRKRERCHQFKALLNQWIQSRLFQLKQIRQAPPENQRDSGLRPLKLLNRNWNPKFTSTKQVNIVRTKYVTLLFCILSYLMRIRCDATRPSNESTTFVILLRHYLHYNVNQHFQGRTLQVSRRIVSTASDG